MLVWQIERGHDMNSKVMFSVKETAQMLGISKASAYQAVTRQDIPTVRIGKRLLVPSWYIERLNLRPAEKVQVQPVQPRPAPALTRPEQARPDQEDQKLLRAIRSAIDTALKA